MERKCLDVISSRRRPSGAAVFQVKVTQARRDGVQQLVERAITRGELAATVNRETILDFLAGPLYWRLVVSGGRSELAHIERLVRMTTAAMAMA